MTTHYLFTVLPSVESTNNYAMGIVRTNSGKHGAAWFTGNQTSGRGQRGKSWESKPNNNIALSVLIKPTTHLQHNPFILSAIVACTVRELLQSIIDQEEFYIKWPNDIYVRDRKAAGILIENLFIEKQWEWAVVGIGINVNENYSENAGLKAISLNEIDANQRNTEELARAVHELLVKNIKKAQIRSHANILEEFNNNLYKKDEEVRLKTGNRSFLTTIRGVTEYGDLITEDVMEHQFRFGEVVWELG